MDYTQNFADFIPQSFYTPDTQPQLSDAQQQQYALLGVTDTPHSVNDYGTVGYRIAVFLYQRRASTYPIYLRRINSLRWPATKITPT